MTLVRFIFTFAWKAVQSAFGRKPARAVRGSRRTFDRSEVQHLAAYPAVRLALQR